MRSFFQDFERSGYDGSIIRCKMHDIVHDFAQFLSKNECFNAKVDNEEPRLEYSSKVRHSMIQFKSSVSFPRAFGDKLRSLLIDIRPYNKIDGIHVSKLLDELTCLRALDVSKFSLKGLPRGIEKLIHLRYLNLSRTNLKELPEALCDLYNLQTLDLTSCEELRILPQGIAKLLKLRHLINNYTYLMHLPKADVGKVYKAELHNKKNLIGLNLVFYENHNEEALDSFQPPPNLEKFRIENYVGNLMPPNWIAMVSLTKLRELRLNCWLNCKHLPPLGKLLFLETLIIESLRSVKIVSNEFLGIESEDATSSSSSSVVVFPKLQTLEFQFMDNWEEWSYSTPTRGEHIDIIIMPCLRSLKIWFCRNLRILPSYIEACENVGDI
ncbi:hypothetical protein Dsin_006746 [Dipteronia sinensis]|uniref:Uncharacterized protein n=1 Tax=Dipteronia sinensis TaxID=43782 RepID=A0AAE0EG64_9ROSI|nr:hypothetical protein Dsin_006746 [Dipteronia sinensis]